MGFPARTGRPPSAHEFVRPGGGTSKTQATGSVDWTCCDGVRELVMRESSTVAISRMSDPAFQRNLRFTRPL